MTDSIFDPTGPQTEHSGSRYLGPDAAEISQMPPRVVDGVVNESDVDSPDADSDTEEIARAEVETADHPGKPNP